MKDVQFGEFRVENLFDSFVRGTRHISSERIPGDIPYYSTTETNNGMIETIGNPRDLQTGGKLIYTTFGFAYYVGHDFSMSDEVTAMHIDGLSENHYLYLATMLNKQRDRFSFGNKAFSGKIKEIILTLPMTDKDTPDWNYMEEYIESIKKKFIESKIAYKDNLKEKLESLLENKQKYELEDVLEEVKFKDFIIGDVFKVESGDSTSQIVRDEGDIKRVTATTKNNGVSGYIDYIDGIKTSNNSIVGNVFGDFNYIKGTFSYSSSTTSITGDYNELSALYIVCVLNKSINGFSFSNKLGTGKIKKIKVRLPEKDGRPDYEYMEKYIKNVMIKTINKIEEENNRKIDELKKIMEVNL